MYIPRFANFGEILYESKIKGLLNKNMGSAQPKNVSVINPLIGLAINGNGYLDVWSLQLSMNFQCLYQR